MSRRTMAVWALAGWMVGMGGVGDALAQAAEAPAMVPVPGFVPPRPGEHPRLLFRQADIPALRRRAATPEGQSMVARLKLLLGSEVEPAARFSSDAPVNNANEGEINNEPVGTFTMAHPAGFGMLYVLTGDRRYADLAREGLDKILEGQVDRDSRYNWTTPGTGFRLSFVLQGICLAYDLCYDAWPPAYRQKIAETVMNMRQKKVDKNQFYTLEDLAKGGGYPPGSNHFGAFLLGPGLAALTFKGDPGADDKKLEALLATVEGNLARLLGGGFGDAGWFAEGTSCGRISANGGVAPLLHSLRVAGGKDYISPRPHARYTVLRLMHEIVPTGESTRESRGQHFPVPSRPQIPHRGDYGDNDLYKRPIISHMGDFAQSMGAVLPREAQAMAWIYDQMVETGTEKTWNAAVYPHFVVYALAAWPAQALDPDEVFPRAIADTRHGYYVARNRWQDADDVLVTTLLKRGPSGYKSGAVSAGTVVWGLREKFRFGGLRGETSHYRASPDGSIELADANGNALVVDFSGASGTTALVAALGEINVTAGRRSKVTTLQLPGGQAVTLLTLGDGEHPVPALGAGGITVGRQTLRFDAGKLVLGQFTPVR